jgi:acetyl-CoA C-acetyltransferase
MLVKSGYFDVVAVEAHAKPSDIATLQGIYELALDPVYARPLGVGNPLFLAALDARAYMETYGVAREHLALVVSKNKRSGLSNPRASFAARVEPEDVLEAPYVVEPLTKLDIASFVDAAVVFVVASEEAARRLTDRPVWIDGVGWSTEAGTGSLQWHAWGRMLSMRDAADMAYKMAGISSPANTFDFVEVEDRFSYMELLSIEEARLAPLGSAANMLEAGDLDRGGYLPVNPSGGSLAFGVPLEATGLARALEAVLQLRGEAGPNQLSDVRRALVLSWRGPPTYTSAALVLSSE